MFLSAKGLKIIEDHYPLKNTIAASPRQLALHDALPTASPLLPHVTPEPPPFITLQSSQPLHCSSTTHRHGLAPLPMASLLESSMTSETIRKLEARRSYMAKAPFQQHKSKKQFLGDIAMKLCPVIWLGLAVIRAHDKHEYKRDRRYVEEVHVEYQEHKSRKNSYVGANGSGSIVDLQTYPAPVEWTPSDDDPWRSEEGKTEDPWQLPPFNEII